MTEHPQGTTYPVAAAASSRDRGRIAVSLALALIAGAAAQLAASGPLGMSPLVAVGVSVVTACGVGMLGIHRAIAPLARSRDELQVAYEEALADALTDQLTKLGNHRCFQEELDRHAEAAQRYGVPLSLVLIDLDAFKTVNDTHGHAAGDKVLARFGRLLELSIRRPDRSFRVGGDEFALLLPHTDADGAWVLARRLLVTALQPVLREMGTDGISFSAGISSIPSLATGREQLYLQADEALYAAKRAGRTDIKVYQAGAPSQDAIPAEQAAAIAEVARHRRLRPVFQPVVELATRRVLGYEGLIRPLEGSMFSGPGDLFAAAEATGHVVELDMACIDVIVAAAVGLPADQFLSVNVSAQTLEAPEFGSAALMAILNRHGMPSHQVVIELTEHRPLSEPEGVRSKVDALRKLGIRFAADDLGAGNAGLRLLAQLRFDVLKVDLSLVQRSGPGAPSNAVIGSVVGMATQTDALVIAEGLEQEAEVRQVVQLGVRAGQGFLLGRPGPLPAMAVPGRRGTLPLPVHAADEVVGVSAWRQSIGLSGGA